MSSALTQLTPTLQSIPSAEVERPNVPMAEYLQETLQSLTFIAQNPVQAERLLKVGVKSETLAAITQAHAAAQEAETNWNVVSGRNKPEQAIADEKRAYDLRSDVVAACRWNLRENRHAQGVLDAVQEGDGVPDLIQDLRVLAGLVDVNAAAFADDETFDPVAKAAELRTLANTVETNAAGIRTDLTQSQSVDLRDRAFTYLDGLVDELKEAGRYVFRKEPERLKFFQNRYQAQRQRLSRKRRAAATTGGSAPQGVTGTTVPA